MSLRTRKKAVFPFFLPLLILIIHVLPIFPGFSQDRLDVQGGGRDVQPTSEEPKDLGVGPGVTDIKQRGGTRQKGRGKTDSGKEGRDEGAVAGMTQDESRRPRPHCSICWCAAALHGGSCPEPSWRPSKRLRLVQ